jgi:hypothetical protein
MIRRKSRLRAILICLNLICLNLYMAVAVVAAPPQFEVATIRPNTGGGRGTTIRPSPGGRLSAENVTLRQLIGIAWDVRDSQISGGPGWMNSDRYDVTAKAEESATFEQMGPMLQSLVWWRGLSSSSISRRRNFRSMTS